MLIHVTDYMVYVGGTKSVQIFTPGGIFLQRLDYYDYVRGLVATNDRLFVCHGNRLQGYIIE